MRPLVRDTRVLMRIASETKERWRQAANRKGLDLSAYIEQAVDGQVAIDRALETEAADAAKRQEVQRQAREREFAAAIQARRN